MQKIKTLYIRDKENPKRLTDEVDPDCQWVLDGEGVATEKYDGSACLVRDGVLYRRHKVKPGAAKPPGWSHWNFDDPSESGHGWAPISDGTADAYHREAWENSGPLYNGTFECVGPKSNGNPHGIERHELWPHGEVTRPDMPDKPESKDTLALWLEVSSPMEGIVWHHPDGRMAKIKRRDFGLPWPA